MIAVTLIAVGFAGAIVFPTDLHGVSAEGRPFWLAKVFLELGMFVLLAWVVVPDSR